MHFLGLMGMPRRIYTYAPGLNWDFWNLVATTGVFIMGLSVLVFVWNALSSLWSGALAGDDPWDARTLEWSIPSPPPVYDFARMPTVQSRDELWRRKRGLVQPASPPLAEPAPHDIHLPPPSFYPIIVAAGMLVMATGAITHLAVVVVGFLVTVFAVYAMAFENRRRGSHA